MKVALLGATGFVGSALPDATFFIAGAHSSSPRPRPCCVNPGVAGAAIRTDKYLGYKPRPQATPAVLLAGITAPIS
ncbi:hypothetical protein GCM10009827_100950 [Dactylosporangium maewongense]|uniref:Uncharacterized protein n=1 Tax=Dactylosporangium maewongense TaxID=634393 RepID=A0ABN2CRP1_9ACTN